MDLHVGVAPFLDLDPVTLYEIWRLRQDVFVVEQECAYADLDGRDLELPTVHVVLRDGSRVVGTARVLEDARPDGGSQWRIGRVALRRSARGQGLSDRLMTAALEHCTATDPTRDIVLDAQAPLAGWYATHGFVVAGEEFLEDGIPHLPMRRQSLVE